MYDIIHDISAQFTNRVDRSLFDKRMQRPLVEYVKDAYDMLNKSKSVTILSHEYTTDATEISRNDYDPEYVKSKALKRDKSIRRLVPINAGVFGQLTTVIKVECPNEPTMYITKVTDIPEYINAYHLKLDGSTRTVINQIVDNSTYVTRGMITMKTAGAPISLLKTHNMSIPSKNKVGDKVDIWKQPFVTTTGEDYSSVASSKAIVLHNMMSCNIIPLMFYLAKFGLDKTIRYFRMHNVVDVVTDEYDPENKMYFSIGGTKKLPLYIEVDRYSFKQRTFVQCFTHMLFRCFMYKTRISFMDAHNIVTWKKLLGARYITTVDKYVREADSKLRAFERLLDKDTKKVLQVPDIDKVSTYALLRWLITNFSELVNKNNHDLDNKRVRSNELMGAHFTKQINRLLIDIEKPIWGCMVTEYIGKRLNYKSWYSSRDKFVKALTKPDGPGQPPCVALTTYDTVNDTSLYASLKTTSFGLTGLPKHVPTVTRDIHPSYIGRLDMDAVSTGRSCGLTSMLVLTCKLSEHGMFAENPEEPNGFNDDLNRLMAERHKDTGYTEWYDSELLKVKRADKARLLTVVKSDKPNVFVLDKSNTPEFINKDNNTITLTRVGVPESHTHRNANGELVTNEGNKLVLTRVDGYVGDNRRLFKLGEMNPKYKEIIKSIEVTEIFSNGIVRLDPSKYYEDGSLTEIIKAGSRKTTK